MNMNIYEYFLIRSEYLNIFERAEYEFIIEYICECQ